MTLNFVQWNVSEVECSNCYFQEWLKVVFLFKSLHLFLILVSTADTDEVLASHISQHGKNWPYWFRKMGTSVS